MIKNKKFLVALMSIGVLAFSQYLVSAVDGVVVSEAPAEQAQAVQTKEAGDVNNTALAVEVVDETANLRNSGNYTLGLKITNGDDITRMVALRIISNRITELLLKNKDWWIQFYCGVVKPEALEYLRFSTLDSGDILGISDRFYATKKGIVYDYSQEDVDNINKAREAEENGKKDKDKDKDNSWSVARVRKFYLKEGIAKKINNLFKDENIRKEIMKPATDDEVKSAVDFLGKVLEDDVLSSERYNNENERKRKAESYEEKLEEAKRQLICTAKTRLKHLEERRKSKKFSDVNSFMEATRKEKENLLKRAEKGSYYTTEAGKKWLDERVGELDKILASTEAAKAGFDAELKEIDDDIKENKELIEVESKLQDKAKQVVSDRAACDGHGEERIKSGKNDLVKVREVNAAKVNDAINSAKLADPAGNFLTQDEEAAKEMVSDGDYSFIGESFGEASVLKEARYARVKFRFKDDIGKTEKFITNLVLLEKLEKADNLEQVNYGEGSIFGSTGDLYGRECKLRDNVVYKCYGSYINRWPSADLVRNFLDGKDDYIGLDVIAKDDGALKNFEVKLSKIVGELSQQITKEDINAALKDLLDSLASDYRWDLKYDADLADIDREGIKRDAFCLDCRGRIGIFDGNLRVLAGQYSEGLRESFKALKDGGVNDENFKNVYVDGVIKLKGCEEKIAPNIVGDDCYNDLSKEEKVGFLSTLFTEFKDFDVNVIKELKPDANIDRNYRAAFMKDSCCIRHGSLELKDDVLARVQNALAGLNGEGNILIEQKNKENAINNDIKLVYKRNIENIFGGFNSWLAKRDVELLLALKNSPNSSKFDIEKVRNEFVAVKQRYDNLSVRGNVEKLTPEQRDKELLENFVLFNTSPRDIAGLVNRSYNIDPDVEVDAILYSSDKIGKYVQLMIDVLDGKLV